MDKVDFLGIAGALALLIGIFLAGYFGEQDRLAGILK